MKTLKRVCSCALACTMFFSVGVESFAETEKNLVTIEEAVLHGIEHSKMLDQVEVEVDLAQVSKARGRFKSDKLRRSDKDLKDGLSAINKAQDMIDQGKLPEDITLPDGTELPAGTDLDDLPLPDDIKNTIRDEVNKGIEAGRDKLDAGDVAIANALETAGATIGTALDFASLNALTIDSSADLIELMPDVAYEVTQASYDIYKNSIALLIQKSYYDVLQAQELLKVKERAMNRGRKQYEFAKAAHEEGMKSKDDMLMAEVYYKSTQIAYEQAKGDIDSKFVELKKNANYRMDRDMKLETVMKTKAEDFNLESGLKSGMEKRLEIKKSVGEVLIYTTNFAETKKSFTPNTFQYREAKLLQDKAGIKYEQAKDEVESSIRQSYALVQTTADMLNRTSGMVEAARENVEIANYKYQEGFGVNTSMLASLNLEDSAGTILEVIAAEEKLAEVEESLVKITYAYNLSRMQYKNNIGDFVY